MCINFKYANFKSCLNKLENEILHKIVLEMGPFKHCVIPYVMLLMVKCMPQSTTYEQILFSIALELVLLSCENMTNTNTIPTVGIVFQSTCLTPVFLPKKLVKK